MRRAASLLPALLLCAAVLPEAMLRAQPRTVDFRYAPPHTHAPVGFPDDWQKTLVDGRGALLYDFGPGPYVRPNTRISVGVAGADLTVTGQRYAAGRAPIILTELAGETVRVRQETFALVPDTLAETPARDDRVQRLHGLTGALYWAAPEGVVDPAFRHVAWGTNRPVTYRIAVAPGSRKRVALGLCESYRTQPGLRILVLHVEGADPVTVDPLVTGATNEPQVFLFDGADRDGDGRLSVAVQAGDADPNTLLNALWVFPAGADLPKADLISGALTAGAEVYVDAGQEPQVRRRGPRVDAIRAVFEGAPAIPVVEVQTTRRLTFDEPAGLLRSDGRPFVVSRPAPTAAEQTGTGWILRLPAGTRTAEVVVINGYRLPDAVATVPDLREARSRTERYWDREADVPRARLEVPDSTLQAVLTTSLRTVYQAREVVDGRLQFQSGMTVYRGLWTHDAGYLIETALMLGDTLGARRAVEGLLAYQQADGQVQVMQPHTMHRETAVVVWVLCRYARLTNDLRWLENHWRHVERGVDWMQALRRQTLADPEATYYGLVPPGFADGGLGGVQAEYSSVFWMLIGLGEAIDMARRLGQEADADAWQALYDDYLASFRAAAARDRRHDAYGNVYLPVRVADTTGADVPQRAQWSLIEALTLGNFLSPDDDLVTGTLAMLDAATDEGLVQSAGWMTGGIWAYFGSFYALGHLWAGHPEKARDILYAFANHATPLGTWVEEQMPKGRGTRTSGDFPHAWGGGMMVRLVRYLLAAERGEDLALLPGVTEDWLFPGASIRLHGIRTAFGPLSLQVKIEEDGRRGFVEVVPVDGYGSAGRPLLHLAAFKRLGYRAGDGRPLPDILQGKWGTPLRVTFERP